MAAAKPAPFQLEMTPKRIEIEQGHNYTAIVTVLSNGTFRGSVNISVAGLPQCVGIDIVPRNVSLIYREENRSTITFIATTDCPVGVYPSIVSGQSAGFAPVNATVNVVVTERGVPISWVLLVGGSLSFACLGMFLLGSRAAKRRARLSKPMLAGMIGLHSAKGERETNEDSAMFVTISGLFRSRYAKKVLLAVADGMGGHNAGELASALCLKVFSEYLYPYLESTQTQDFCALMSSAMLKANSEIRAMAMERPEASGMGTTFVGATVVGNELNVAWVGDSRAYLIRGQGAFRLTKDHSKIQPLVDSGELSPQQARFHPDRNIVTRSIGRREEALVDTRRVLIAPNDILLLCSDGLTDVLDDNDVYKILKKSTSPQAACDQLVASCLRSGASDNVTVIMAAL